MGRGSTGRRAWECPGDPGEGQGQARQRGQGPSGPSQQTHLSSAKGSLGLGLRVSIPANLPRASKEGQAPSPLTPWRGGNADAPLLPRPWASGSRPATPTTFWRRTSTWARSIPPCTPLHPGGPQEPHLSPPHRPWAWITWGTGCSVTSSPCARGAPPHPLLPTWKLRPGETQSQGWTPSPLHPQSPLAPGCTAQLVLRRPGPSRP